MSRYMAQYAQYRGGELMPTLSTWPSSLIVGSDEVPTTESRRCTTHMLSSKRDKTMAVGGEREGTCQQWMIAMDVEMLYTHVPQQRRFALSVEGERTSVTNSVYFGCRY